MSDDLHAKMDDLYTQIGKALSAWSALEERLCKIYAMAVIRKLSDPIGAAASSFWALNSFEAKLSITNAAIRFRVTDTELLSEWTDLFKKLPKKAGKRGQLAHGTVVTWHYENTKTKTQATDVFFAPSFHRELNARTTSFLTGTMLVSDSTDTRPEGRLYRDQVKAKRKAFDEYEARLKGFYSRLYGHLEKLEKDRALAHSRLRGSHTEGIPIPKDSESPPQSSEA